MRWHNKLMRYETYLVNGDETEFRWQQRPQPQKVYHTSGNYPIDDSNLLPLDYHTRRT